MTPRVNLLPAAFAQHRHERRRRRTWIALCVTLAATQAVTALVVNERTREVHRSRERAMKLNSSLKQEKAERDALRAQADQIVRDTAVAERLREKHYWSRWLGSLSLMVPQHVMLTTLETEPAQFDATQGPTAGVVRGVKVPSSTSGVRMVRLRGSAAQHEDLMSLYKAMNGLKWFHSVQLEEAKRQKVADSEVIGFALACDW